MWQYNNEELYHYGVKGMKWGVRRAQKRLARLTGRKKSDVSQKEAEDFLADLKFAKKNKGLSYKQGQNGNKTVLNRHGMETNAKYGQALVKEYKKRNAAKKIGSIAGTAAAAVGGAVVANLVTRGALLSIVNDLQDELDGW